MQKNGPRGRGDNRTGQLVSFADRLGSDPKGAGGAVQDLKPEHFQPFDTHNLTA
jgi:hypothetical protein